jgi:hypothetical protein
MSVMLEARYRWTYPSPVSIPPDVADEAGRQGLSTRMTEILARRGLSTAADLRALVLTGTGPCFSAGYDLKQDPREPLARPIATRSSS